MNIPSKIFDKYNEVIDCTINDLGVVCQLVYVEQVEIIDDSYDNIPDNNSINAHRRRTDQYERSDRNYREVETLENVQMKVYFNRKDFAKVAGNIVLPEGAIFTVFWRSDLPKVLQAKEMIVHQAIKDDIEIRMKMVGAPFPYGFLKNRYMGCYWE